MKVNITEVATMTWTRGLGPEEGLVELGPEESADGTMALDARPRRLRKSLAKAKDSLWAAADRKRQPTPGLGDGL
jgi:hypothetical protein